MDMIVNALGSVLFFGLILWIIYSRMIRPVFRRFKPKFSIYKVNTFVRGEYTRLLIQGSCNREEFEKIAMKKAEEKLIEDGLIEKGEEFELMSIIQVYEEI